MREIEYNPEEVKELLRKKPVLKLHGLDGKHYEVQRIPIGFGQSRPLRRKRKK